MKLLRPGGLAVAALTLVFAAAVPVATADEDGAAGHVYVLNNGLVASNSITVFARACDCTLAAFAGRHPAISDQKARRHTAVAVDADSNQISVIDAHDGQFRRRASFPQAERVPSA